MFSSKIWLAFALVSFNAVFAQQNPKTQLTVQVTDVTGAPVPRASIEITPSSNRQGLTLEADGNGNAEVELPPGNYDLHVMSRGFCPFRKFLEPLSEQNRMVTAKLIPGSCPGPCAGPCVTVYSESGVLVYPKARTQDVAASQDLIKVTVTDTTGAVIQPAWVEATSTSLGEFGEPWSASTSTNTVGEAALGLPKGNYVLSVTAKGFKKWSTRIESGAHRNQAIRAKMVLADNNVRADCMSCFSVEEEKISPRSVALSVIQPMTIRTLDPLPSRHAHGHIP